MDVQFTKLKMMQTKPMDDLADYVRRVRLEKGMSVQDVENAARRAGFSISRSYVSQIENRYIVSATSAKLQALAKGLGVSEDEIFAVARGKPLGPLSPSDFDSALAAMGIEHLQAFGGIEHLTDEDRQEIIAMIQAMIEQKLIRRRKSQRPNGKGKK